MRENTQRVNGQDFLSKTERLQAKPGSRTDEMLEQLSKYTPKEKEDRSYHSSFVRKKSVRVKVRMLDGSCCIGDCHVVWPDGRTSDVINEDRPFLILTDATVEGEHHIYNVLTINKKRIEMIFELHRD